ncbi:MAG: DNA replication/repair protein RecF [Candidatus Scatovivens sp.]
MYIEKITLNNFRNYKNQEIHFKENVNIIYGNNAQGKTNIVESIFLCAMGKSFRTKKENELIKFGENIAKVQIEYKTKDRNGKIDVEISDKKVFYINGIKQNKISNIIGNINIVMFTPDNIDIIKGGPSKRRRFLDMMISSLKPNYLHLLNMYNKVLEQRNNYLRKNNEKDLSFLDILDEQLAEYSLKIYEYRRKYIEKIEKVQSVIHKQVTESGNLEENIRIEYISNCRNKTAFINDLKKYRNIDIKKGYTSLGIHRDDFIIYINNKSVSIYGSQGQQRTAILSLKLSELEIVEEEIGEKPILLLDDFMSELDETRRKNFIERIKNNQVIITGTDKIEIDGKKIKNFYVKNGEIYT